MANKGKEVGSNKITDLRRFSETEGCEFLLVPLAVGGGVFFFVRNHLSSASPDGCNLVFCVEVKERGVGHINSCKSVGTLTWGGGGI